MTLIEALKESTAETWQAYTHHDFVNRLGDATLPLPMFQDYLVQDYLFLIQYARANALAAYKSRTLTDIRLAAAGLEAILSETLLHQRMLRRWGITEGELHTVGEKLGTVAYTRYVLDCGLSGDLLDLRVALAPCVIGYAEIGRRLAPQLTRRPDHPYRDWIAEYASPGFQEVAQEAEEHLELLAARSLTDQRFDDLVTVFRTATRLETDFWHQAIDISGES